MKPGLDDFEGERDAPPSAMPVRIPVGTLELLGDLVIPPGAVGLVVFAHGSGSSRHSPRNRFVAAKLHAGGLGTLLFDLLTEAEDREDEISGPLRFDIRLLGRRLVEMACWVQQQERTRRLGLGLFGSSTGAAAALVAAAELPHAIQAVVSRGGRPDLAAETLARVKTATLLIVGEHDDGVRQLNDSAYHHLNTEKQIRVVPRATHLFEEPGALEAVSTHATGWFRKHLHFIEPP